MRAWTCVAAIVCLTAPAVAAELPFRPLDGPGDRFTASLLTATYAKDPSLLLNPQMAVYLDLDQLDRYGTQPPPQARAAGSRRIWADPDATDPVAELSPEEKEDAIEPTAGVQVGIPSYISVPGTLIGGAALLVHVLRELF